MEHQQGLNRFSFFKLFFAQVEHVYCRKKSNNSEEKKKPQEPCNHTSQRQPLLIFRSKSFNFNFLSEHIPHTFIPTNGLALCIACYNLIFLRVKVYF